MRDLGSPLLHLAAGHACFHKQAAHARLRCRQRQRQPRTPALPRPVSSTLQDGDSLHLQGANVCCDAPGSFRRLLGGSTCASPSLPQRNRRCQELSTARKVRGEGLLSRDEAPRQGQADQAHWHLRCCSRAFCLQRPWQRAQASSAAAAATLPAWTAGSGTRASWIRASAVSCLALLACAP